MIIYYIGDYIVELKNNKLLKKSYFKRIKRNRNPTEYKYR